MPDCPGRLPGEAALADLPPQPGPRSTARGPACLQVIAEGIEDAAAAVGMPPGRRMTGAQPASNRLAADAQGPSDADLVPKNWTDGLALDLISNPRERIRRR